MSMTVKLKCTDIDSGRYSAENVVTLREQYPNKSDDTLTRYLVANNNDVVAASLQLQKADKLSEEYANIIMSRCINEIAKGEAYIHGEDRDGRPLIIVHARLHDPVNRNVKESVLMTLWWTEQAIARLPDKHSRFTILLDRDNCENAADTEYMQALAQVFLDLHPERLHRAIVYPSGIVFYSMWNLLLKWFMAENTREKVLPAVSLSDVLQHIDERYVPASLGGKSVYKFDINDFHDPEGLESAAPVAEKYERAADRDGSTPNGLGLTPAPQNSDANGAHDRSAATTVESPDERADSRELEYSADDQDNQDNQGAAQRFAESPRKEQQQEKSPHRPRHHVSASSEYELPPNSGDELLVLRGVLSLEEFEQVPSPREYGSDLGDHFLEEDELEDAYDEDGVYESEVYHTAAATVTSGKEIDEKVEATPVECGRPPLAMAPAPAPAPAPEGAAGAIAAVAQMTQDTVSGEDTEGEDVWKEVSSQDGAPEDGDAAVGPVAMFHYGGSQASPCSFVDRLVAEPGDDAATPYAFDDVSAPESYHYNVNRPNTWVTATATATATAAAAANRDILGIAETAVGARDAAGAAVSTAAEVEATAQVGVMAEPAVEWECWREVGSDDGAEEAAMEAAAEASTAARAAAGVGARGLSVPVVSGTPAAVATAVQRAAPPALAVCKDAALLTAYVHVALSAVWCSLVGCVVGIGLYSVYYPSSVTFSVSITALAQLVLLILLLCSFL